MNRLNKIRSVLAKNEAVLISSVANISYLTGYSRFSKDERDAYLIITSDAQYLITHALYAQAFKEDHKGFSLLELSTKNPMKKIFADLVKKHDIKKLLIEEYDLRASEFKSLKKRFKKLIPFELEDLRAIKDEDEIYNIKKACEIGDKAFEFIKDKIKIGVSEIELEKQLKIFFLENNAEISFPPIVAFGSNAAIPHHQTGETKLNKDTMVLMDFGVMYKNYCSDMTRTVVLGEINERQKIVYNAVYTAQKKAVEYIVEMLAKKRPVRAGKVDEVARSYISEQGFSEFNHSLGHGIGVEVHEFPSLSPSSEDLLKEGMVFSIEPGIYLPGEFGVRIEDLFAIINGKLVKLTNCSNKLIQI